MPSAIERCPDGTDLAVHHSARRHHLGTGVGLGDGDAGIDGERGVVVDRRVRVAGGTIEYPTVTVIGVFVDTKVGHQHYRITEVGRQIAQA